MMKEARVVLLDLIIRCSKTMSKRAIVLKKYAGMLDRRRLNGMSRFFIP